MSTYVAYIGCDTYHGNSKGIGIYDADVPKGRLTLRCEVPADNCQYLAFSPDRKYLYASVDEGILAFEILPDGGLRALGTASIRGMRADYISVHPAGFIAAAGYHDGKLTVLAPGRNGCPGKITAEYYDKGIGSVAERNFRPHAACAVFTPDGRFLLMADSGIDQIRVFAFDEETGGIELKNVVRCEMNSSPHRVLFNEDGSRAWVLSELANTITVYRCTEDRRLGLAFEVIQTVGTLTKNPTSVSAACALTLSPDRDYLYCTNAGENTAGIFSVLPGGLLKQQRVLPVSGDYPKDLRIFPDGKHLISMNMDSDTLTFFTINHEQEILVMNGLPLKCDNPNCCLFLELNNIHLNE